MKRFIITGITICISFIFLFPIGSYAEKTVIIDPGHGGKFSGTCGYSGRKTGFCEKDANLAVAVKLKEILEKENYTVFLTRSTDIEFAPYLRDAEGNTAGGDFDKRMEIANSYALNNNNRSIFISIHHNANPTNPFIRGIETYYYDGLNHFNPLYPHDPLQLTYLQDNKRLAESVHNNLVESLKLPNRKVHNDQSFYVIRNAQMPSILVELGFMINRHEEKLIKTTKFQQDAAQAIANGVHHYFNVYELYSLNYYIKKDSLQSLVE